MAEIQHLRATYNDIHKLIQQSAVKIAEFKPDLFIAIGDFFFRFFYALILTKITGGGSVELSQT